ncbi:MAG: recombination protein RecR [Limisphaerales bacterium]|jgi:recombination protein RecR
MSSIDDLIDRLQVLPGVGPKSAQRMALYLLQSQRPAGIELGRALDSAMKHVRECSYCRNFTELEACKICRDTARDAGIMCVVESPADILAFEQAGGFRGYYFVLHGKLSPLDGVGPEELKLELLFERVDALEPKELILATNPTVEGEATAHYIARALDKVVPEITRIAHGVSLGSEIEYTDGGTLAHALQGRRSIN